MAGRYTVPRDTVKRYSSTAEKNPLVAIVAQRITELREERDWNRRQAAEAVGMSQQTYGQLEKGARLVDLDHILKLSRGFNVAPADLLTSKKSMSPLAERVAEAVDTLGPAAAIGLLLPHVKDKD